MSVSAANGAHALVVLVVEDDFFARSDVADCLRDAGYVVIETESGEEAIALCKSDMSIDMVSPTSISLARRPDGMWLNVFESERPDMPVLYTSGEMIDPGRCVPGSVFVAKPYQHDDILIACRRLRK